MTMADVVRGRFADADAMARDPAEEPVGADLSNDLRTSRDVFQRAVAVTDRVLRALRARTSFSVTVLEAPLEALLESLLRSDVLLLPFFKPGGGAADSAETVVNVSVLSMKIGAHLGYPHDALRELGLAALLYQAGLRPTAGDDVPLVQGLSARHAGAAVALASLRERASRSGDTSDRVNAAEREPALIVGLASTVEGLVRRRPLRSGGGHSEIIKEVLERERGAYPDNVLTAAIRILASLPVGALVRLNTGEICRVVAKKDGFPLRPILAVLVRQHKRVTEPTAIDLSQHPFLRIQGFVTEAMLDREAGMEAP
ncbi:MAG TPA: hypothetical protein VIF11_22835 [Methylomirabilota bacterium]|jgi:hypothetical protein